MRIGVLGPLEVEVGGSRVDIAGARLGTLLALLALDAPRPVSASALVDALWGDEPPASAANALQTLVSRLRRALGDPGLVLQSAAGYRLDAQPDDIDAHRFESLAHAGRDALAAGAPAVAVDVLGQAVGLWRGEPFGGSEAFDVVVARLTECGLTARADLIEARIALGEAAAVVAELESLVAAHPLRERFAALLLRALHLSGRQAEGLAAYERIRGHLAEELGADPAQAVQDVHLAGLRGELSPQAAAAPNARRGNLRATLTSFVGRDDELARLSALLATERLITLVGPGGAGKTRLAVEAATAMPMLAADGFWMAELAPLTDPGDVAQTVLGSLGLREAVLLDRQATSSRDTVDRLIDLLADRAAVVLLDNCEHMLDATAELADRLLARCPNLRILATSREALGIVGEVLVAIPPLGQPAADADARTALEFPAVRLFADRAGAVRSGFEVDARTVGSVVEIVRRLDGLPLAIELAAARLRSLPVEQVAARLGDRFRLLTGGSRTALPRHRTLHAVVAWSWDLLDPDERVLAERLAVFAGGVTPSSAAAVHRVPGGAAAVGDLLSSLADKSLLQLVDAGGEPRYRMLETIREFGMERLADRGEVAEVRGAHAEFFAELVATAEPHLRTSGQLRWMRLLAQERDNVIAALKFAGDTGDAGGAIGIVANMGWYWILTGNDREASIWARYALDVPGETDPGERTAVEVFGVVNATAWDVDTGTEAVDRNLDHLATLAVRLAVIPDDYPAGLFLLAPVAAIFAEDDASFATAMERALNHPDTWVAASAMTFRASLAENAGDVAGMRADAETSLAVFRRIGERWGMANCLQTLGVADTLDGKLESAVACFTEALDLIEDMGASQDQAMMRLRLADVYYRLGRRDDAYEQATRAEAIYGTGSGGLESIFTRITFADIARADGDLPTARSLRDECLAQLADLPRRHPLQGHGSALILAISAKLDLADGDLAQARERVAEAYTFALGTKDMPVVAGVGAVVAMLAHRLGEHALAAEMLGAAAGVRGSEDATQPDLIMLTGQLRDVLGADAFERGFRAGQGLSRDEALVLLDPARLG